MAGKLERLNMCNSKFWELEVISADIGKIGKEKH